MHYTNQRACNWNAKSHILVFGNSHEPDGLNFLYGALGNNPDVNVLVFGTTNRCQKLNYAGGRYATTDAGCQERLNALFDANLVEKLDMVVYASNRPYAGNKGTMLEMLGAWKSINPRIRIAILGGYYQCQA